MALEHPDPNTQALLVRGQARTIQDPGLGLEIRPAPLAPITGWQIVAALFVVIGCPTLAAVAGAETAAVQAITTLISTVVGFLLGRSSGRQPAA